MITRRDFLKLSNRAGIAAATMPLWSNELSIRAFAQLSSPQYKAVLVIALTGGNDGNNMIVPIDTHVYQQYSQLRGKVALSQSAPLPLDGTANSSLGTLGLHPSLVNVARRFNKRQALVVANVGPLVKKLTKAQLLNSESLQPQALLSHPAGVAQWQSATTVALPDSGWGGRIADVLSGDSGSLPPAFSASGSSIFTVGHSVQGVAVQSQGGGAIAIPSGLQAAVQTIAESDAQSSNLIVSQVARLRKSSMEEQALLLKAAGYGPTLNAKFSTSAFGASMKMIAQIINGRSIIGASRQLFYCAQGNYDHHQQLITNQAANLSDLDANLGAFMDALDEMGLTDQVMVCTHSDFNRTMQSNMNLGTDHGWGNHQIIIGGGLTGGRIVGDFPDLDLGGDSDMGTQGIWIPTTSVTQMTAGIGSWMGLTSDQISSVFPDLTNFQGPLQLS
ncbi:DUF1501 domain-containing protein [Edaphobacter modestus]|uniref:Uncharacterized protein (DUF1501 family) n=1 Tax=Edaphobacter modestus TaxID=388466 RepID=A0A4Q7YSQ8_9BACT|nr:DUF1501 domain-containing protein [Edaphobacter modestus]RZU40777.1 uncharacterized protein (DUF1501 family) [Edaphobacter modestus]